jgi:hypothetical protein
VEDILAIMVFVCKHMYALISMTDALNDHSMSVFISNNGICMQTYVCINFYDRDAPDAAKHTIVRFLEHTSCLHTIHVHT